MYLLDGALGINSKQLKDCNVDWVKVNRKKRKEHMRILEKR
jgi:hypothetical protein